ncbi:hypothetical protein [Devosia beringensis]|uniref:hypothetical protein n=1 Tax=Devosia beringensis TaxID=2657486 RepID=UPI00186B9CCA|nr:hypothetical protein [Devosia beringensis]
MRRPGDNGGPPLDDSGRPWGEGKVGNYFEWKKAKREAFDEVPYEIAMMRARRAEKIGLTYAEYTLELMERGRFLQAEDVERIAEIIAKRGVRY